MSSPKNALAPSIFNPPGLRDLKAGMKNKELFEDRTHAMDERQLEAVSRVLLPSKRLPRPTERGPSRYTDSMRVHSWLYRFQLPSAELAVKALHTQPLIQDAFQQATPEHITVDKFFVEVTEKVLLPYEQQLVQQLLRLRVALHLQVDINKLIRVGSSNFFLGVAISFALPASLKHQFDSSLASTSFSESQSSKDPSSEESVKAPGSEPARFDWLAFLKSIPDVQVVTDANKATVPDLLSSVAATHESKHLRQQVPCEPHSLLYVHRSSLSKSAKSTTLASPTEKPESRVNNGVEPSMPGTAAVSASSSLSTSSSNPNIVDTEREDSKSKNLASQSKVSAGLETDVGLESVSLSPPPFSCPRNCKQKFHQVAVFLGLIELGSSHPLPLVEEALLKLLAAYDLTPAKFTTMTSDDESLMRSLAARLGLHHVIDSSHLVHKLGGRALAACACVSEGVNWNQEEARNQALTNLTARIKDMTLCFQKHWNILLLWKKRLCQHHDSKQEEKAQECSSQFADASESEFLPLLQPVSLPVPQRYLSYFHTFHRLHLARLAVHKMQLASTQAPEATSNSMKQEIEVAIQELVACGLLMPDRDWCLLEVLKDLFQFFNQYLSAFRDNHGFQSFRYVILLKEMEEAMLKWNVDNACQLSSATSSCCDASKSSTPAASTSTSSSSSTSSDGQSQTVKLLSEVYKLVKVSMHDELAQRVSELSLYDSHSAFAKQDQDKIEFAPHVRAICGLRISTDWLEGVLSKSKAYSPQISPFMLNYLLKSHFNSMAFGFRDSRVMESLFRNEDLARTNLQSLWTVLEPVPLSYSRKRLTWAGPAQVVTKKAKHRKSADPVKGALGDPSDSTTEDEDEVQTFDKSLASQDKQTQESNELKMAELKNQMLSDETGVRLNDEEIKMLQARVGFFCCISSFSLTMKLKPCLCEFYMYS